MLENLPSEILNKIWGYIPYPNSAVNSYIYSCTKYSWFDSPVAIETINNNFSDLLIHGFSDEIFVRKLIRCILSEEKELDSYTIYPVFGQPKRNFTLEDVYTLITDDRSILYLLREKEHIIREEANKFFVLDTYPSEPPDSKSREWRFTIEFDLLFEWQPF